MKLLQRLLVCCILFPLRFYGQSADDQLFRAAISASSDSAKLAGLNKLIMTYPQSKIIGDAYGAQFSVLMSLRRDSAAFFAAHNYLAAKDSQSLPAALHNVAMELAFRKQYPDSALLLVDSAITLYREKHGRLTPVLLHTRAMILYLLKRFSEAESTQNGAIALLPASAIFDPRYSNYFAQLGMIQLEAHPGVEGLEQYVHASFTSSQPSVEYANLDSLFHSRVKDLDIDCSCPGQSF